MGDLPPEPADPAPAAITADHQLTTAFLVAFIALVVVGGLLLLLR